MLFFQNELFFSYFYHGQYKLKQLSWWWYPIHLTRFLYCYLTTTIVDMSLYSYTFSWFWINQSLLWLLSAMSYSLMMCASRGAANTNVHRLWLDISGTWTHNLPLQGEKNMLTITPPIQLSIIVKRFSLWNENLNTLDRIKFLNLFSYV